MRYKCGMGEAYIDEINKGEHEGRYGIFHTNRAWEASTRKDLSPTTTMEEAQGKLDVYAKSHKLIGG